MEADYIQIVQKHSGGKPGRRGCDEIAKLFGEVVSVMEETRQDVLGDLFQGRVPDARRHYAAYGGHVIGRYARGITQVAARTRSMLRFRPNAPVRRGKTAPLGVHRAGRGPALRPHDGDQLGASQSLRLRDMGQ